MKSYVWAYFFSGPLCIMSVYVSVCVFLWGPWPELSISRRPLHTTHERWRLAWTERRAGVQTWRLQVAAVQPVRVYWCCQLQVCLPVCLSVCLSVSVWYCQHPAVSIKIKVKKGRALVIAPQIDITAICHRTVTAEALRYMARTKQRRTYLP